MLENQSFFFEFGQKKTFVQKQVRQTRHINL